MRCVRTRARRPACVCAVPILFRALSRPAVSPCLSRPGSLTGCGRRCWHCVCIHIHLQHLLSSYFHPSIPIYLVSEQFPIVYKFFLFRRPGGGDGALTHTTLSVPTGSHSHSSVCAPARSARASTNTAAPTSAPTAAATPSTRCRRCRASATTAAAAAW